MTPGVQYLVTKGEGPIRTGDRVVLRADGMLHWEMGGGLIAACTLPQNSHLEFVIDREWLRARIDVLHSKLRQLEDLL